MEKKSWGGAAKKPARKKLPASRANRLFQLFIHLFVISASTFGGGFVIISLMKKKFVDQLQWIDETEMMDYTSLAQSTPGAIAVNAGALLGLKIGGVPGMITAVAATALPPMIILSIISLFYAAFASNAYVAMVLRGMQAGVAAVILDVVLSLGGKLFKGDKLINGILLLAAFILSFCLKVNVIFLILAAILIGVARGLIWQKKEGKK